ncbi:type II toxin-antitoxin system RelB family antitoxin [Pseudoduganella sp. OTU4001]|uniref:type II toxin-antitoxin system RelB family antitoxin n=1 Tax=Pseudoduganella sp. OTU4001 TaxID=3043854 RepID=UPI00313C9D93
MNTKPIPPDLDSLSPVDEAEYDRWFREKVSKALMEERPLIPHDEVMKSMRELILSKRKNVKST